MSNHGLMSTPSSDKSRLLPSSVLPSSSVDGDGDGDGDGDDLNTNNRGSIDARDNEYVNADDVDSSNRNSISASVSASAIASDGHGPDAPAAAVRPNTLMSVCSFIIVNEFCERMAFYGFQGSLVLFMTKNLHFSPATADTQSSLWNGFAYITPLLGAWFADARLGRFNAIMIFIIIYFIGMLGVTLSSQTALINAPAFFISLYVVALGTGGIKPNVSTFGADQFDESDPADRKQLEGFFSWFYLSINLGALVSYTLIAYLCQNVSFDIGYAIPTAAMFFAIITFYCGRKRYKILPPSGSVLSGFLRILVHALYRRCSSSSSSRPSAASVRLDRSSDVGVGVRVGAGGESPYLGIDHSNVSPKTWMDYAKLQYGGLYTDREVEDVASVVKLVPFLLLFIVYWAVYNQMSTSFFNQGCQMDLAVGSLTMPVSALNLFDTLIIIVLIPIFEQVLYPALKKAGIKLTMLRKIGCGFVFATLSMVVAALVEMSRLSRTSPSSLLGVSICFDDDGSGSAPRMVPLSVFWQTPQFLLIGVSEVLASVTALELFYDQAPLNMRSVCAALNLITTAFGNWFSALLVPMVNVDAEKQWITHDANQGHLDYYFWLLAGLMGVNTIIFVFVAVGFEYTRKPSESSSSSRDRRHPETEQEQEPDSVYLNH